MAENSKIEWTHHTFNCWRGCTKVSAGCKNCYAETMSKRNLKVLGQWGPNGTRVIASEAMWKEPLKWNAAAKAAGERHRVFCASLPDVFEGPETMPAASREPVKIVRARLLDLIADTPHLDWLLLTKRPDGVMDRLREIVGSSTIGGNSDYLASKWIDGDAPANVWLGTSVEDQKTADERIPQLLRVPAVVRFLSMEPLLGAVDLRPWLQYVAQSVPCACFNAGELHWVIVGGESGPGARPFDVAWARSIVAQCKEAGVPVFVKQFGAAPIDIGRDRQWTAISHSPSGKIDSCVSDDGKEPMEIVGMLKLKDPKGGDPSEWPEDLRVREFPVVELSK